MSGDKVPQPDGLSSPALGPFLLAKEGHWLRTEAALCRLCDHFGFALATEQMNHPPFPRVQNAGDGLGLLAAD
jgi:hypothetical protein